MARPNNRGEERKSDHQNNFCLVKRVTIVRFFFRFDDKTFLSGKKKKRRERDPGKQKII